MKEVIIRAGKGEYTLPRENIIIFAQYEAMQRHELGFKRIENEADALAYLTYLGLEVEV